MAEDLMLNVGDRVVVDAPYSEFDRATGVVEVHRLGHFSTSLGVRLDKSPELTGLTYFAPGELEILEVP